MDELLQMLTYKRPMGSAAEREFRARFLHPLGVKEDIWGNLHLTIGTNPRILWSSHTDTVHRTDGRQMVVIDDKGIMRLAEPKGEAECLGADDGAGVWLMMQMARARVPGLYIFHYGEERGCIGSKAIAEHDPGVLEHIDFAIAFDRCGTKDIITSQMMGRCCSDAFARSLAAALNMGHRLADGVYTDTASYVDLVPECTNVSVGYQGEHSAGETLDTVYLQQLLDAILVADFSTLKCERDPAAPSDEDLSAYYSRYYGDRDLDAYGNHATHRGATYRRRRHSRYDLEDIISEFPEVAETLLLQYGVTRDDLTEAVRDMWGDTALRYVKEV